MTDFDASLLRGEGPFALGASGYWDAHPEHEEAQPRIYVRFRPEGTDPHRSFLALLDTGAHFGILHEEVAKLIQHRLTDPIGSVKLRTALGPVQGELYRYRIQLVAEVGRDLFVDSTLFVAPGWRGPSFLGYSGALERLRFAVDPRANRFYFGPLE